MPRALAFEHRFAAAVADPGVVDVSTSWTDHLPSHMRAQLAAGERVGFDRNMRMGERFPHKAAAVLAFRGRPYAIEGGSVFDLFDAVRAYRLGGEVARITTPVLVTDPENEQFRPGRSQQLYDRLPGPRGDRALHRARGGRPALRADGPPDARRTCLRLAGRPPGPPDPAVRRAPYRRDLSCWRTLRSSRAAASTSRRAS